MKKAKIKNILWAEILFQVFWVLIFVFCIYIFTRVLLWSILIDIKELAAVILITQRNPILMLIDIAIEVIGGTLHAISGGLFTDFIRAGLVFMIIFHPGVSIRLNAYILLLLASFYIRNLRDFKFHQISLVISSSITFILTIVDLFSNSPLNPGVLEKYAASARKSIFFSSSVYIEEIARNMKALLTLNFIANAALILISLYSLYIIKKSDSYKIIYKEPLMTTDDAHRIISKIYILVKMYNLIRKYLSKSLL